MNAITLPEANQLYVLIGSRGTSARLLDLAARLSLRGSLLLLDCANQSNPLPLVRELRRLTGDPVAALRNIQVARAFTCYQVLTLLEQAIEQSATQPVIILDLLSSFYDESIRAHEGRRLLEACLRCITHIRRSAPLLVSARPPLVDFPEHKIYLEMLCRISDRYWIEAPIQGKPPQQTAFL